MNAIQTRNHTCTIARRFLLTIKRRRGPEGRPSNRGNIFSLSLMSGSFLGVRARSSNISPPAVEAWKLTVAPPLLITRHNKLL